MFSRIHEKLGTAGFVISIVALVAALTGGAYAAGGLSPQVKKQITKESKKFSKKFSKQFAVAGPQGAKGDTGAAGAKGDAGAAGANGSPGTPGTPGEDGMCSEANPECALPLGGVLTGKWSIAGGEADFELATISFPLRVSPAPTAVREDKVVGITIGYELKNGEVGLYGPHSWTEVEEALGNGEDPTPLIEEDATAYHEVCPGSAAAPEAASGFLCIYVSEESGGVRKATASGGPRSSAEAADEFGVTIPYESTSKGAYARGTWAVAN